MWEKPRGHWKSGWVNTDKQWHEEAPNGIAVHVQNTNHCINWEGITVQRRAAGFWQRRTVEAIQMRTTPNMNLDSELHPGPTPPTSLLTSHSHFTIKILTFNFICEPLHTSCTIFATHFSHSHTQTWLCNPLDHNYYQCLLYNVSHTVCSSLTLYAADKGLQGWKVQQSSCYWSCFVHDQDQFVYIVYSTGTGIHSSSSITVGMESYAAVLVMWSF